MNTFTAGSCIRYGWDAFKKRPWFFIGAALVYFIVVGVVTTVLNEVIDQGGIFALLGTLARIAVQMLTGMGAVSFALKAHDDLEHVSIMDFWHPIPFWKYTGTTLLFGVIVFAGFVLIIVPGVIWGIMFGYSMYLVIDKQMWPMEALKESKRITYGYKWELLVLAGYSILVVIVGTVCLGVGLLVAYPIVLVANTHAFRTLQQKAGATPSVA
jgi:uncharacterized membrane protein